MNPAGRSVKTGLFEETWEKFIAQSYDYGITVAIKTTWRIKKFKAFMKNKLLSWVFPISYILLKK